MSAIENNQVVNAQDGCARYTFPAENRTTGEIAIFSILNPIPDFGFTFDISDCKGRAPETGVFNTCKGALGGKTKGNRTYEEKALDVVLGDDYNFLQSVDEKVARNLFVAVLMGQPFEFDGATWVPLGTNGTRNVGTKTDSQDHGYLFTKEGELFEPDEFNTDGTRKTSANNFVTALNENNTMACEMLYKYNQNKLSGHRFVYVLNSSAEFQEGGGAGGDYNKYAVSGMRECDARYIDKYFITGLTDYDTVDTVGADEIFRVNANIVIHVSGGGAPTVAGTAGDVAVVVDTDDNTVEIYKYATTWSDVPVTSTLGSGCLIFTESVDTALDGATATTVNSYVAVKTAGTSSNAIAIGNNIETPASAEPVFKCYDWSFSLENFQLAIGQDLG